MFFLVKSNVDFVVLQWLATLANVVEVKINIPHIDAEEDINIKIAL